MCLFSIRIIKCMDNFVTRQCFQNSFKLLWQYSYNSLKKESAEHPVKLSIWSNSEYSNAVFITGFPGGTSGKDPACQCKRSKKQGFNPWARKTLWRRRWQPTPVFLPGNPMDRGAWRATVHRVTESGKTEHTHIHNTIIWWCVNNLV